MKTKGFERNFKKSLVALTLGSLLSTAPGVVLAADDVIDSSTGEVERIEITGSRIKRVDTEGASPVTVFDSVHIEKLGFSTVAEVLQFSTFNPRGSGGNSANNTWSSQQTIELRGQSLFHTLVLLDGQPMAKSPVLDGGASSINDLPLAAVERIEVLTDGASAVYGSDAVAGVVNIILKKDFDGIQVKASTERAEIDGGDRNTFSLVTGTRGENSSSMFVYEHDERSAIGFADVDYAKARVVDGDPSDIGSWFGLSTSSRVIVDGSTWDWKSPQKDGQCDSFGEQYVGPLGDSEYPNDVICAYDYTQDAQYRPHTVRDNIMASFQYDITDDIEFYVRGYWAHMNSTDVSAAASVSSLSFDQALPETDTLIGVNAGDSMRYRFTEFGQRTAEYNNDVQDLNLSLSGDHENFSWDFSYNFNRYTSRSFGRNYVHEGLVAGAVGVYNEELEQIIDPNLSNVSQGKIVAGWDPRDANSQAPDYIKANFDRDREMKQESISGGIGFEAFELPGGTIGVYLGGSYREVRLQSLVDAQADAGNVVGGSGGSAGISERDIIAAFAEVGMPITEELELNIAARYDDYSDFGDTFNPQISARYQLMDNLVLRASWGTGFRAPTLVDINQESARGFTDVTDYVACYNNGLDLLGGDQCNIERNVAVDTSGNKELTPEESTTWNVGAIYNITDDLYVKADYWNIELEELITEFDENDVMWHSARLLAQGSSATVADAFPGTGFERDAQGRLIGVNSTKVNLGNSERRGLDIELGWKADTGYGELSAVMNWAHTFDRTVSEINDFGELETGADFAGDLGSPDDIVNLSLSWSKDDHTVSSYTVFYDKQKDVNVSENPNTLPSWAMTNLTYRYDLEWNANISFKVLNAFDRKVPLQKWEGSVSDSDYRLYPVRGRALALSYSHTF
ncbi:TonB-dependent receptor plug domain-containing protein [Thalassomonas haliotis]|uniref:TonB-dependent receptor n=1 Tax=Thalassomonas haliotis TaxID=485448 RepID=A0ABY7VHJ2_9GAMM|nr:TonB-dependent receptor [Thalassomonas haliotis]WDE12988.1 TonB-dependent receptor [Thalassomonas haliotis]